MQTIHITAQERDDQRLDRGHLAEALAAMSEDGIVCLQGAADPEHIARLHDKMQSDLDQTQTNRKINAWSSLRPPPFAPYLYPDIVYNEFAIDVCHGLLGPDATLTTYGANTSWPGEDDFQRIHRDVADGPVLDTVPAVVLNFPMIPFTAECGATLIYPGSHRASVDVARGTRDYGAQMLDARAEVRAPEQTIGIGPGDVVVRDLRLWHGGTPNQTPLRRIMLALVVIDPHYRGADESGFKGFEAHTSARSFFQHPRLRTSVHFVDPEADDFYLHSHHSKPPTALKLEWDERQVDPQVSATQGRLPSAHGVAVKNQT